MEITIKIPDDCDIDTSLMHVRGCFTPSQLDYQSIKEGIRNGVAITFCNNRNAYFYKTKRGYTLQLQEMEK